MALGSSWLLRDTGVSGVSDVAAIAGGESLASISVTLGLPNTVLEAIANGSG